MTLSGTTIPVLLPAAATVVSNAMLAGTFSPFRVNQAKVRAVRGEPEGTFFHAQEQRVSSFKLWLRYAKAIRGRIVVDGGAEAALRERGTSLLPVGVVEVHGDFQAGDAVQVTAAGGDGAQIGKGIVNYSADELRQIKGMQSAEVRQVLPRASEEAVHRDYFVLEG